MGITVAKNDSLIKDFTYFTTTCILPVPPDLFAYRFSMNFQTQGYVACLCCILPQSDGLLAAVPEVGCDAEVQSSDNLKQSGRALHETNCNYCILAS